MFRASDEAAICILCATIDTTGDKISLGACRQPDISSHLYRSDLFSVIALNGTVGQILVQHFHGLLEPPYTF